jgi:hypothetical protein
MFTDEECSNMHFVFSFCGGNGRAAVALLPTLQSFISQNIRDCKKVKQSHYRPGQAQRVPGC